MTAAPAAMATVLARLDIAFAILTGQEMIAEKRMLVLQNQNDFIFIWHKKNIKLSWMICAHVSTGLFSPRHCPDPKRFGRVCSRVLVQ